ncbi:MAG: polymer-forming cytoskeletal protein [Gemmatimonadota bacterium]|nr:polymer-forming cytoskeletal protein [Gemmatimonadota bacterium]
MRTLKIFAVGTVLLVFATADLQAQSSQVVAHRIERTTTNTTLIFETADGAETTIIVTPGAVSLNGTALEHNTGDGAFAEAFATLVSQVQSGNPNDVLEAIRSFEAASERSSEIHAEILAHIALLETIETGAAPLAISTERIEAQAPDARGVALDLSAIVVGSQPANEVRTLALQLRRSSDPHFSISNGTLQIGDVVVGEGDVHAGNIAAWQGDVIVRGAVEGNVLAIGGDVIIGQGGTISGDAGSVRGEIVNGGAIAGETFVISSLLARTSTNVRAEAEAIAVLPSKAPTSFGERLGTLLGFFVSLSLIGFGVTFFLPRQLDIVTNTLTDSFGRSFVTGGFAAPLVPPFGLIVTAALAITVIGIPLAVLFIPLFVLAILAAGVIGYLSAANAIGTTYLLRRLAQGRGTSVTPYRGIFYGLIGLLSIWLPAVVFAWIPMMGSLFFVLAALTTGAMMTAGFGAMVLSRAGLRSAFSHASFNRALTDEYYWNDPSTKDQMIAHSRRSR